MTLVLWRYISLRFFTNIVGAFALLGLLIFMVDFIEVLRSAGKFGGGSMATLVAITALRLPAYAELTLPFAVLVGTIASFLGLSRSSELIVIRAAGVSVWQFIVPGLLVGGLFGALSVGVYNPLAAQARASADELRAETFKRSNSLLKTKAGSWLRQDSPDGQSIISAKATARGGQVLAGVTVLQYNRQHQFTERIEAARAELFDGYWQLSDALVARVGEPVREHDVYLIATYLTGEQVTNALGSVISISIWDLPKRIELAEKAGLSSVRYSVQFEQLLARPALLMAMVLLGATVSLRAFRFGKIQTLVVIGLTAGFGFFIFAEMSRQVGLSGLVSAGSAAWVPILLASCLSVTALLYQEDG
ncbi:MAG: LPS export ABC transporter permease LptG [Pseudomonadota bacterium]